MEASTKAYAGRTLAIGKLLNTVTFEVHVTRLNQPLMHVKHIRKLAGRNAPRINRPDLCTSRTNLEVRNDALHNECFFLHQAGLVFIDWYSVGHTDQRVLAMRCPFRSSQMMRDRHTKSRLSV